MGIFRKKKDKEEEAKNKEKEGSEKEGGEERSVKVKKIKDLNSENKKRRKEPVRAWNKFDRIVLLLILVLTAGSSSFLAVSSRGYKLPELPRISLPKINLFGERVVVLESGGSDEELAGRALDRIGSETKALTGIYGIYVVDLKNNFSFGIYENEKFQAASLIKLPVMLAMYQEEESGLLNLDTKYKLKAGDKVKGSGSLYGKPVGYELTYRELIKLMGKESDNTAFNICRKYLGDTKIEKTIKDIGMSETELFTNETTAEDISIFFHRLWDGELIKSKNREELLGYLTDTIYEDWLKAGVPEDIRVAHKYGRELKTVNDAGIIYSDRPYIAVIMSKNIILKEADNIIPKLSEIIYDEIENTEK